MNATPNAPLPLILVTGFLGAGKTTLLLRWLQEAPATGKRMGVIMNEFGQENIDSQILQRPDLPIEQVSGGCLCCADDAAVGNAVSRLARSGLVDYIVVETSGLADPDLVIDTLTDPELLPIARLHGVVTVIDAQWLASPEDAGERVLARKQIQFAHIAALSRCDCISEAEKELASEAVRKWNPTAQQIRLPFGLPDLLTLLNRPSTHAEIRAENDSETTANPAAQEPHLHTIYQSLSYRIPLPIERPRFEAYLSQLNPREVVRAKGFIRFAHAPEKLFVFQSVFGHHFIEEFPARPHPDPVAVLIGPHLDVPAHQLKLRQLIFGAKSNALKVSSGS